MPVADCAWERRRTGFMTALAVMATLISGCGEPVTSYRVSEHNPAAVKRILVLPFLDTRTFRDKNDPVNGKLGGVARDLFVDRLRQHEFCKGKTILVPEVGRDETSLSLAEALDYGHRFDADLVIVGQIFSYTETRAASIPPRAGMFVRFFSVPMKRVVFVGDDYRYAAAPGATGGRRAQAELAADELINSYVAANPPAQVAAGSERGRQASGPIVLAEAAADAPGILLLPYHERINPNNLIRNTGGGAVVTSILRMELAKLHFARIFTPAVQEAGHKRLLSVEEALALGRRMGVDYVLRGQVVEFRRAMSVPSFYSVLISTAILAAQILFSETSGVDIATELWRVKDGKCVYASRDVSKQKYVVQAEKTVRRLAGSLAVAIRAAVRHAPRRAPAPVIDGITVVDRTRRGTGGARRARPRGAKPAPTTKPATQHEKRAKPKNAAAASAARKNNPRPLHEQDEDY